MREINWGKEFEKKFMYNRGEYLEFDLMKAGNVGELIDFIHHLLKSQKAELLKEIEKLKKPDTKWHVEEYIEFMNGKCENPVIAYYAGEYFGASTEIMERNVAIDKVLENIKK